MRSLAIPPLLLLAAGLACSSSSSGPSDPDPPESPTSTFLTFTSDPGEWVGQGLGYDYDLADGVWTAEFDTTGPVEKIHISVTGPGNAWWWELHLAAPIDRGMAPGKYTGATRWPFQNVAHPGLAFSGTGRGCNEVTGNFEIHSLTLGPNLRLDQLHASFVHYCEGGNLALRGEVSIVANPWAAPLHGVAPDT